MKYYDTDCGETVFLGPFTEGQGHVRDLYQNFIIPASRRFFSPYARPKLNVVLQGPADFAAHYEENNDRIVLYNTWWGAYGAFTMAHEYGHALWGSHGMGLNLSEVCNRTNAQGQVDYGIPQDYTCAMVEGWANFHGAWVIHTDISNTIPGQFESNWNYAHALSYGDPAGAPDVVGSMLYDLADTSAAESFDQTAYSAGWIASRFVGCSYYVGGTHLYDAHPDVGIWCLESRFEPTLYSTYFPGRSNTPTSIWWSTTNQNPGDASWQAHVRQVWLRDFYGL